MSDDRDDEEVADYGDDAMVQVDENDADDRSSYNGSHIDEDSVVGMETTTEAAGTTAADRNGNPTEPPQRSIPPPKPIIVDREKTCPFLIRVVCVPHQHNEILAYDRGIIQGIKINLYTWKDATFRELAYYIREQCPAARDPQASLSFRIVWQQPQTGRYQSRSLGRIWPTPSAGRSQSRPDSAAESNGGTKDVKDQLPRRRPPLADIQLAITKFTIGDCMDVAILTGNSNNKDRRRW